MSCWIPALRPIATRFPTVDLGDRAAGARDLDALYALEALTDPRVREEAGLLSAVRPEHRKCRPGYASVMAAFTHLNPKGSRLSERCCGVFYTARQKETAIAEARFRLAKLLAATTERPIDLQMGRQRVDVSGHFAGLRQLPTDDGVYGPLMTTARRVHWRSGCVTRSSKTGRLRAWFIPRCVTRADHESVRFQPARCRPAGMRPVCAIAGPAQASPTCSNKWPELQRHALTSPAKVRRNH